jgi:hypothetical protein
MIPIKDNYDNTKTNLHVKLHRHFFLLSTQNKHANRNPKSAKVEANDKRVSQLLAVLLLQTRAQLEQVCTERRKQSFLHMFGTSCLEKDENSALNESVLAGECKKKSVCGGG